MLTLAHSIRQHSTKPSFTVTLLDKYEQPLDVTGCSVSMYLKYLSDSLIHGGGPCNIIEPTAGLVEYEFTASDTQIAGAYLATIEIVFPGGARQSLPFNSYYLIEVEADLMDDSDDPELDLVFATPADAKAMGYTLTGEELIRAQGMIEIFCGRMVESIQEAIEIENISKADIARLKKATVYQAVWIAANEDVEERTDVTQLRTAGLSGESAMLTADGIVLSPLAARLLRGLSWTRSRSIKTTTGRGSGRVDLRYAEDGPGWKPLT